MQVELHLGVAPPREGHPRLAVRVVPDHPVEAEAHHAVEEDLGQEDEDAEDAGAAAPQAVVIVLAVSGREVKYSTGVQFQLNS